MTTAIKGCENNSDRMVSIINPETPSDSRTIGPETTGEVYAWISQHEENPLRIQTKRGTYSIWDKDHVLWEKEEGERHGKMIATFSENNLDFKVTVYKGGEVSLDPLR